MAGDLVTVDPNDHVVVGTNGPVVAGAGDPCCCGCADVLYVKLSGVTLCTEKTLLMPQTYCGNYTALVTLTGNINDVEYTIPLIESFPGGQCNYGGVVENPSFTATRTSPYSGITETTSSLYIYATKFSDHVSNFAVRIVFPRCGTNYNPGTCPDISNLLFQNGYDGGSGILSLNNMNPDCSGCYSSYGGVMTVSLMPENPLP